MLKDSATIAIGAGHRDVLIDEPVPMSGFAARTAPSTGDAEPRLRASAIALADHVWVVLDTIGVDPFLAHHVEQRAARPGHHFIVSATHTHAGPGVLRDRLGRFSNVAHDAVVEAAALAVHDALAAQQPCHLEVMTPIVAGVAHNRRRGQTSPDAPLSGFRWLDTDGVVRGCLISYPCHPTSLGPTNQLLSGDYPGFLRRAVEQAWDAPCVFATGCAGDINTGHSATASFGLGMGDAGRTLSDSARAGEALAEAVVSASWSPVDVAGGVQSRTRSVQLDLTPLDPRPLEEQRAAWTMALQGADDGLAALLTGWIAWSQGVDAERPSRWDGEVTLLRIGGADVFLLPGEPFLDAAHELERRSSRPCFTVGYTGDCPGYFPSAPEYALEGYEVQDAHRYYGMPAPFARGSMETLVDAVWGLTRDDITG